MRIIGGRNRGLGLVGLGGGDPAAALRPTSDRVRETMFNLLAHGDYGDPRPPTNARVLDLFAGTGALGLEALSRGARHATFVDQSPTALSLLRRNVGRMGEVDVRIVSRDATRLGRNHAQPYDLMFVDPPYGRSLGERAVAATLQGGWLAQGALVVWEEGGAPMPPPGLTLCDSRRYGETMLSIFRSTVPPHFSPEP